MLDARTRERLLSSGQRLIAQGGCRSVTVRKVTMRAKANIGSFVHYFRNRDAFLLTLLDEWYQRMLAGLQSAVHQGDTPRERLRGALWALVRFIRDHRTFIVHLLGDALSGERVARTFLREHFTRHQLVLIGLIREAKARGEIAAVPDAQAVAFLAGAVGMPILFFAALTESRLIPRELDALDLTVVWQDEYIAMRIDMALAGLAPRS